MIFYYYKGTYDLMTDKIKTYTNLWSEYLFHRIQGRRRWNRLSNEHLCFVINISNRIFLELQINNQILRMNLWKKYCMERTGFKNCLRCLLRLEQIKKPVPIDYCNIVRCFSIERIFSFVCFNWFPVTTSLVVSFLGSILAQFLFSIS